MRFWTTVVVVILIGCGGDESLEEMPPRAIFLRALPLSGSVMDGAVGGTPFDGYDNSSVILYFDALPRNLTVSHGKAAPAKKSEFFHGDYYVKVYAFKQGPLDLTVTWDGGSITLNYVIATLDCCHPSTITGGTVIDGDKDVDPEALNSSGVIEIEFSEDMTGNIALQTEDGTDVGWIGKVEGNKAILELVRGKELQRETTYVVKGKVQNAAGEITSINVIFVTKAKE